ncbi:MAG: hypothetical protein ACYCVB_07085 [Bacilli bacterium]
MDDQKSRSESFALAANSSAQASRGATSVTVYGRHRENASKNSLVFLLVVIVSGVICLLLSGYLTHPGLHVVGSTLLLDIVGIRQLRWAGRHARRTLPSPSTVACMQSTRRHAPHRRP